MILGRHINDLSTINPVELAQLLYSRYCIVDDDILDKMESVTVPLEQRRDNLMSALLVDVRENHRNLLLLADLLPQLTEDQSLSAQLSTEYSKYIIIKYYYILELYR